MFRKNVQQGNVMIVVLFVIIVMGYLAASLMKVSWSNQGTLTREFLGTKALFIAQSANEWALTQLYPLNDTTPDVANFCTNTVSGATPNVTEGTGCQLSAITCSSIDTFEAKTLFKVRASTVCGSGRTQVQRQFEVWVKE